MKDRHERSLVKAITWRVTGTLDTFLVALLITQDIKPALAIGGIEIVTKMTLYYFHERAWNKIKFGREKAPEYEI